MAFIQCDFSSQVLGISTSINVVLPQGREDKPYPTLYLLHGLSDDHTGWMRRTSIERYAMEAGIAVVMPGVHRSFYTDMEHGYPYFTFVSEELIQIAESFFPLSSKREHRFVAGLSMGGYGAFKLALRHPEKFAAAASLSGAVDIVGLVEERRLDNEKEFKNIFGSLDKIKGSGNDLLALLPEVAKIQQQPRFYQCCGTEDFLYQGNQKFRQEALKYGLDLTYEEGPGDHTWSYWDTNIYKVIQWIGPC